jgi:hypothetical protein
MSDGTNPSDAHMPTHSNRHMSRLPDSLDHGNATPTPTDNCAAPTPPAAGVLSSSTMAPSEQHLEVKGERTTELQIDTTDAPEHGQQSATQEEIQQIKQESQLICVNHGHLPQTGHLYPPRSLPLPTTTCFMLPRAAHLLLYQQTTITCSARHWQPWRNWGSGANG